ncbi:MAG: Rne/Rng family ribonuclease [Rhodospirillaceae bacterium]|jgi:ribonuclease E
MTTKKMLIDSTHPEETRVVILNGNRLENFDVEVESRKQLKGNIYLAKVTRVEPSLQAAFVDYGGNRHGFLAFNEIHPDYYQIPVADREELIEEQKAAEKADEESREDSVDEETNEEGEAVETLGGDESEEVEERRPTTTPRKRYKIQEVIKRRQILLIQVVKEERGTKGAALTTYLSLAGRYCVLMPNTARGGGISRKITNAADRKKMRTILADLGIPDGMAVIMRTAGINRTKAEIKRDYEYLFRLWDQIRNETLQSTAPCLIHEEANLIKRSIRDQYSRDISEVLVEGEEGYRFAKDFMKLLIPSHAKRVKRYDEKDMPLFQRNQVEGQLDAMLTPIVHLKSGGYIVINPTEALVAIDVNSGRATRERNIEETALKTNLEAAEEVSRQLRLRDLAGLIVIDFIDMEVRRNNVQVERRLKECMAEDRARIQIGRISHFGLLELSRQRLRPSLMETNFETCVHCNGMGVIRSIESTALSVLRAIEEESSQHKSGLMTIKLPTAVALYLLNHKRSALQTIEERESIQISVDNDDSLIQPDFSILFDGEPVAEHTDRKAPEVKPEQRTADSDDESPRKRKRRPRRRRKSAGERDAEKQSEAQNGDETQENAESQETKSDSDQEEIEESGSKRRRRGKRGGRRRTRKPKQKTESAETEETADPTDSAEANTENEATPSNGSGEVSTNEQADSNEPDAVLEEKTQDEPVHEEPALEKPTDESTAKPEAPQDDLPPVGDNGTTVINIENTQNQDENSEPRRGWWNRG